MFGHSLRPYFELVHLILHGYTSSDLALICPTGHVMALICLLSVATATIAPQRPVFTERGNTCAYARKIKESLCSIYPFVAPTCSNNAKFLICQHCMQPINITGSVQCSQIRQDKAALQKAFIILSTYHEFTVLRMYAYLNTSES